jgi:glycosyltransferase involved in cell wall biosynthesis
MPEVAGPAALQADPLNPSAIGQQIYNLLSDQVLQDELIKRGQTRASDFTWQRTARQVLDIYRTVFESNLL